MRGKEVSIVVGLAWLVLQMIPIAQSEVGICLCMPDFRTAVVLICAERLCTTCQGQLKYISHHALHQKKSLHASDVCSARFLGRVNRQQQHGDGRELSDSHIISIANSMPAFFVSSSSSILRLEWPGIRSDICVESSV
jgi:hypothetical protein